MLPRALPAAKDVVVVVAGRDATAVPQEKAEEGEKAAGAGMVVMVERLVDVTVVVTSLGLC